MSQMKIIHKLTSIITALALTLGLISHANASSDFAPQNAGISYYVAVNGSDLNACTQAAPCKSFNKAMSVMQSGDTLYVTAGTYNQEMVIAKSGLTIIGQGATIDTTGHTAIMVKSTAQNIVVRGFTVTKTFSHAIWVEGKFVTIENNTVYHSVLENGTLSNGVITCGNNQWGSAIKTNTPASDVVIRGNLVYENCGEGIAATMSKNIVIENNTVRDSKNVNIYIDNSSFVKVLNNNSSCTKSGNKPVGIALGEETYSGWGSQLRDITISGNTVTKCWIGIMAYESDTGGTLTNVTFSGNFIPSADVDALSLDNNKSSNVLIANNTYYKAPWIKNSAGVTLKDNIISTQPPKTNTPSGGVTPTLTNTPTATITVTSTPTQTAVVSPTTTLTGTVPTKTPTPTVTGTLTTQTSTVTPIGTLATITPTIVITGTLPTQTKTSIPSSPTTIVTGTLTTKTAQPTSTHTYTFTPTLTNTPTATMTATFTSTATVVPSAIPSIVPTVTQGTRPTRTPKPTRTPEPPSDEDVSGTYYDDTDPAFVYSNGWVDEASRRKAYGGSYKMTNENGSYVTFNFTGESFSVLYTAGPAFRKIDVYVDGVLIGTINQKAGSRIFQAIWDSGNLTSGAHTLKLVFTSESRDRKGSLDAVIVQ